MKYRHLKGILLLVMILIVNGVIQRSSSVTAWASGVAKVVAAPDRYRYHPDGL